ncbi:hypothetical protein Acsp06_59050 [Actinomycetospora sp. NBRC 106375]|uniref:FAD-dependent monooxygenase n=1 Tax=Actinomycetospora sp. NBRC 106375 TaxID=3032207 RepID=UPI0024A11E06|nr:FAD-dependent monooxygenase [Actinomycetospora sp. NBRC 106375]GLZ49720.1 hypothetical protein Acsp06_59050 [Actinomycetospora sp. NBRC 106375]
MYRDGVQVARTEMALPPDVPYGFTALPQYTTERLLAEELHRHGGRIERSTELVDFSQDADGVSLRLRTPTGDEVVRTAYLVGADGAHSVVRKGLGLSFAGDAFPEEYMLGDVVVDWTMPPGYAVRCTRRGPDGAEDGLVAIPLPGRGRYRLSMLAPPELRRPAAGGSADGIVHGLEAGEPPAVHHLQAVVDRLSPEPATVSDLRWSSVFRISHRLVDRYGIGRVFVAGDAAHIHPPTGGQGMNTGIQDALNLAWKLALVVDGLAASSALPLRVHVVVAPELGAAFADAGEPCLVDSAGDLAAAYGMRGGDAVLIRPDGYVGWTARPVTAAALGAHLAVLTGVLDLSESPGQVPQ